MKPFKHQAEVLARSKDAPGYALFMDTGTGKTKVALDTAADLFIRGKIDALLVVAPAGTYRNWTDIEIPKHLPDMPLAVGYWKSTAGKAHKAALWQMASNVEGILTILAVNVEAFSHPNSEAVKLTERFLKTHRCLFVVDESTQIKLPASRKTKVLLSLSKLAPYRRVLSGFPAVESPQDLFSQCLFLNTPDFPYSSFFAFRNRYCKLETVKLSGRVKDRRGRPIREVQKVVGAQHEDELHRMIESFGSIIHKSACLDLPPKVYERRVVELTDEQKHAYKKLDEEAYVQLQTQEVTALNVLAVVEKLHQIVCGFVKSDLGSIVKLKSNRIDSLLDQVAETNGKIVIWANYIESIQDIAFALDGVYGPGKVACFYGATKADERPEIMARFQDPKSPLRFLVANPSTGKFSWTLTEAHTCIYFSNSYKLEDRLQSEDRLHRIGQTTSVTYIDLVTPETVDEDIIDALLCKYNIAASIMGPSWKGLFRAARTSRVIAW